MDVSFFQVEATGHGAVADALTEQREGQQDSVGQGQASTSGHSSPGFGVLKQVCDVLLREKSRKSTVTVSNTSQTVDSTGISGEVDCRCIIALSQNMYHDYKKCISQVGQQKNACCSMEVP